jgi:serine/threonine protein kinase
MSGTGASVPETIGRYRLLAKIAKGGMAEVFAARSYGAHGFEKTVALKRILPKFGHDPQFVRMMVDEAKISVLLNHPNIAQILELGEQEGDYFIVMEFVPGQSLSAVVKRLREDGARLPTLESCFVVVELLQGLHAAHTQRDASGKVANIIHRDVSPQNTLVSFDGHVKVIDFGIARARDRLEATEVGTIKGKLRYLAPEMIDPGRFHPHGDFDHRVDVFAAGIVLWELISGRTLFVGDDEMKVYDDITDGVTPDLHKDGLCDAALMKIIGKALERDLSRRYATAEDFADDLRAYVYRTDPAFTHKRVAATLDRLFPDEKATLLALERGQTTAPEAEPSKPAPLPRTTSSAANAAANAASGSRPQPASTRNKAGAHTEHALVEAAGDGLAHDTRTMRSDKGNSLPSARPDAPTAVVDRDAIDPGGSLPRQREVTVMTIVSRESVLGTAAGALPPEMTISGDSVFSGTDDATVTVSADTLRVARAAGVRKRAGPQATSGPSSRASSLPPSPALAATANATPSSRVGPRIVVISAAVGVLIALGIVGVVKLASRRPASGSTAVATTPPAPVTVEKRVSPADAVVTVDGHPWTDGLVVAPGVAVVVDVSAPGHASQHVTLVPTAGAPLLIEVTLVSTAPVDAGVVVAADATPPDSAGPSPSTLPAAPSSTPSSAPSSTPAIPAQKDPTALAVKDANKPPPKAPSTTTPSTMTPATTPATMGSTVQPRPVANVAVKGEGTLLVKASPYWGQVSVDGRVLDDQTPVSVKLPAGRHDVVVSHPPRGLVKRFKVLIAPGETVTRAVTFD